MLYVLPTQNESCLIYVLTCCEKGCGMQYIGQTKRKLKERFREHFNKMKKPKRIDTFLYKHFARAGNS